MTNDKKFITDSPKVNFFFGLILGIAVVSLAGFGYMATKSSDDFEVNLANQNNQQVAGEQQDGQPTVDLQITDGDHYLGDKNARVKIFTFSDFQCPYCARHHETMHQLVDEYGDKIAWVFKQFPIASHPLGMPGAIASECAGEQGKFWEMSDIIFENQSELTEDSFAGFAVNLGMDVDQFNSCVTDNKYQDKILTDYNTGVDAGVRGTPSNFINNELVPGAVPYEQIQQLIDSKL